MKRLCFYLLVLCLSSFASADDYYRDRDHHRAPPPAYYHQRHHRGHDERAYYPGPRHPHGGYVVVSTLPRYRTGLFWIVMGAGQPLPPNVVAGGYEYGRDLFVCRANYHGYMHPGKWARGRCHISMGGRELAFSDYEILVSPHGLSWAAVYDNQFPAGAIVGGEENGVPLYICRASYRGGVYSGKVVNGNCNIPVGGREIVVPEFSVLVR